VITKEGSSTGVKKLNSIQKKNKELFDQELDLYKIIEKPSKMNSPRQATVRKLNMK